MSIKNDINNSKRFGAERIRTRGFTFVEVVAALLIVSISLLALIRLHLVSVTTADRAHVSSRATLLAGEKIAEILASGYPDKQTRSGTMEEDALSLKWQTRVTDMDKPISETDTRRMRKVSVDISWEQGTGEKHVQMSTYVADRRL